MSIRTRQRAATLIVALLPLLASSGVALAQPAQPAATLSPREEIAAGDRLRRLHIFDAALASYQRAYAAAPSASTLRRIAETQRDLGDPAGATASFERLAALPDATRDDKRTAEKELKALESASGSLSITSGVEGAAVTLDGRALGVTPIATALRVSVGPHAVRVTKDGFVPFSTEIEVGAGAAATVNATLKAEITTGSVLVSERSGRAVLVSIDGAVAGTTPYAAELPPGEHTFEVAEKRLESPRLTVVVAARQRAKVVLDASATVGTLKLETLPPTATVAVDGKPVAAGTTELDLSPGRHELTASAEGWKAASESIDVVAGSAKTWTVSLVRLAPKVAPTVDYAGAHFDVGVVGTFALHARTDTCPGPVPTRTCSEGTRLGGGLLLRTGYNFGVLGIDLTALGFANHYANTTTYAGGDTSATVPEAAFQHSAQYLLTDVGAIVAIGPTATSHGVVRVTGGVAGGVGVRFMTLVRNVTGDLADASTDSKVGVAPAGVAHLGLLIGSTPGANVELGLMFVAEMQDYATAAAQHSLTSTTTGASVPSQAPPYALLKDVQLYIGPTLGGRFGY